MRRLPLAFLVCVLAACGKVSVPVLPDVGGGDETPPVDVPDGVDVPADPGTPDDVRDVPGPDAVDPGGEAVECAKDEDCKLPPGASCWTYVCDPASHTCAQRFSQADTACVLAGGPDPSECVRVGCNGTGECVSKVVDDGTSCVSLQPAGDCTTFTCQGGECKAAPTPCDDGNPCTKDTCTGGQCTYEALNTGDCDDGDPCTMGTACFAGQCVGVPTVCDDGNPCTKDLCSKASGCIHPPDDAAACDDGSPCTAGDYCAAGQCRGGAQLMCDDGNPCTDDVCDAGTGGCAFQNNTAACNDGNPCTGGDRCAAGACVGTEAVNCDDGKSCTDDVCDPTQGCLHPIRPGCQVCSSNADCSDGDPCTQDVCGTDGKCANLPATGPACDDRNPCTTGDACLDGKCVASGVVPCDDSNPCTDDACNPADGACLHSVNTAACDDKNPCTTGDACAGGTCAGTPVVCDDKNPCTDDACDSWTGQCAYKANTIACDDKNPCTLNDACKDKSCQGAANPCDDGNVCTKDACVASTGCTHEPIPSCLSCTTDAQCDDGNVCTKDQCSGGKCAYSNADGNACDDGNPCTSGDACAAGRCVGPASVVCNDNNACTSDACDPAANGCVYTPVEGGCDDGNACTGPDTCVNGACQAGPLLCCDGQADGTACSDSDAATSPDYCVNQKCRGFLKVNWTAALGLPTRFTDVDASLGRVYAVGYTQASGVAQQDGIIAQLPFGEKPVLVTEANAKGTPYRAVSRGLAVGDDGLVAYRYSWTDSAWTIGGVLNKALIEDGNPPGNLTGAFSVAGGCPKDTPLCGYKTDIYLLAGVDTSTTGTRSAWAKECLLSVNSTLGTITSTCGSSKFSGESAGAIPAGAAGKGGTCKYCSTPCLTETTIPCMNEGAFPASTSTGGAATYGDVTADSSLLGPWAGGGSWSMWAPRDISRVGSGPSAGTYLVVGDSGTVGTGSGAGSYNYLSIVSDQDNYTFYSVDARGDWTYVVGRHATGLLGTGELMLLIHSNAAALDAKGSWTALRLALCPSKCTLSLAAVSGNATGVYVVGNDGNTTAPSAVVWYLPAP